MSAKQTKGEKRLIVVIDEAACHITDLLGSKPFESVFSAEQDMKAKSTSLSQHPNQDVQSLWQPLIKDILIRNKCKEATFQTISVMKNNL